MAFAAFDMATMTYVAGAVLVVQIAVIAAGLLAFLGWTGVVALHKSARRDLRAGHRRVMAVALMAAFSFLVLAQLVALVGAGWAAIQIAAFALMIQSGVTAFSPLSGCRTPSCDKASITRS